MELSGERAIDAPVEAVWEGLNDREVLAASTPGCKELTETAPDTYEGTIELGVAAIKGQYSGVLRIEDREPLKGYTLHIDGEGGPGFVNSQLTIQIETDGDQTHLRYEGSADVGGTIARIGQRMLSGVAGMIMNQFFESLANEIQNRTHS